MELTGRDVIMHGFNWESTPQGGEYWAKVYRNFGAIIRDNPQADFEVVGVAQDRYGKILQAAQVIDRHHWGVMNAPYWKEVLDNLYALADDYEPKPIQPEFEDGAVCYLVEGFSGTYPESRHEWIVSVFLDKDTAHDFVIKVQDEADYLHARRVDSSDIPRELNHYDPKMRYYSDYGVTYTVRTVPLNNPQGKELGYVRAEDLRIKTYRLTVDVEARNPEEARELVAGAIWDVKEVTE